MRTLIFLVCASVGAAVLLWAAGGIEGPRARRPDPTVERAASTVPTAALPLDGGKDGGALRLDDMEGPRYAMPEPRVFRDPATGERVEIPHFLPWAFWARAGRAVPASTSPRGGIQFQDVVVRTYREPETLAEARRLRDDPRAIDGFVRLELLARQARADGIADALDAGRPGATASTDLVILLEDDVRVHERTLDIVARGDAVAFDPRTHRAAGTGPFTVVHPAWSLEGEDFVLTRGPGSERGDQTFRLEVSRRVFLSVNEALAGADGRPMWGADAPFRPARVFAGRAAVAHDGADPKAPLKIVLDEGVRALQEGGRRLDADRLALTLEPRESVGGQATARGWDLAHLVAEGRPVTIEVPDLEAQAGTAGAATLSARRLRHEPSALGPATTVLEGSPVVLFEGDLALAGGRDAGGWLRASATDRAVLTAAPVAGTLPDGTPVAGRRIELKGAARIERRGGATPRAAAFEDVLEGDEITLVLRPGERPGEEIPVSFAALGHVRLSGTRLDGRAERIVVERLDSLTPVLVIEGQGTRLALVGFDRGARLYGAEPSPAPAAAAPVGGSAPGVQRGWEVDRLEAVGSVRGATSLGGPALGVPAWLEAERIDYDRVSDRVALTGPQGGPASVRIEAGPGRQHGLAAPRLSFERERARLAAEGGVSAEVHLGGEAGMPGRLASPGGAAGELRTLALDTDGRIELRLTLAAVGGEPALDAPQTVEIRAPFTAELLGADPAGADRLRADRLSATFAMRTAPEAAEAPSALARPARTDRPHGSPLPRAQAAAATTRWTLASRTLVMTLEQGELSTFEADGGTTLESEDLHLRAERLRFARRLGLLTVEGGSGRVAARLGVAGSESQMTAQAVRITLDEQGPRWIGATGPLQAVLVQRSASVPGRLERFELDCAGDARLGPEEFSTLAATWVRRTLRAGPGQPWTEPSEIWADRVAVTGTNLLALERGAAAAGREVRTVIAEGPKTTLRSGQQERRVEIWCRRIEVDVPTDRAVLTGAPGHDVVVHFEGGHDVEIARAAFDFRTGEVQDLEAGRAVLRRGR